MKWILLPIVILVAGVNAQDQSDIPIAMDAFASFHGEAGGDEAAWVGKVGDLNGDGFDDVVIGAAYNDQAAVDAGKIYIFFGSAQPSWSLNQSISQADASFLGTFAEENASNVVGLGDVNGDGMDDLAISAYSSNGRVYILLGSDTAANWGQNRPLTEANGSIIGSAYGDICSAASPAGDVNGDGLDDFLVGARENDEAGTNAGQVYLFLGHAEEDWGLNLPADSADASFLGAAAGDQLGYSGCLGGVGDVNGDGLDDFLLGAPFNDEVALDAGKAYLFLGRAAGDWGMDLPVDSADGSFLGEANSDYLAGISSAGDVNEDDLDDFCISAQFNNEGGADAGQVYLFLGRATADWHPDLSADQADASYIGEYTGSRSFGDLNACGDVNGDGHADLLLGGGAVGAGELYLLLGNGQADWGLDYQLSSNDISWVGEANGDFFGFRHTVLGDVNGDGSMDIAASAHYFDRIGANNCGKVYIILGSTTVSLEDLSAVLPKELALAAYPNPFNPSTTISYALPSPSDVTLTVYDITGRTITALADTHKLAGTYSIQWNGTDDSGNPVSSGVYFCRLQAGDYSKTIKMVYLK